jgi:hypothetical protein
MTELLIAIGTLATVLVGIALLLQITSIEGVLACIGRAALVLVLMLVALCVLKSLWVGVVTPWLSAAFEFLRTVIEWLVVTILGLIAVSLISRVVLGRAGQYLTLRRDPQTGDEYGVHDCKDTNH